MRLIWHLVRADLRRHRWPIAAWLVTVSAATTLDGVVASLSPEVRQRFASSISVEAFLLIVTLLLFSVLLTVLVVQGDPPVGTDAFWMTRPIDPRILWAAKLAP
jgi:hypothetical protein